MQINDELIKHLIDYQNSKNVQLYTFYSSDRLLKFFDYINLQQLTHKIKQKPIDIVSLVNFTLESIDVEPDQIIYIILGLIDLFEEILHDNKLTNIFYCWSLSEYICKKNATNQIQKLEQFQSLPYPLEIKNNFQQPLKIGYSKDEILRIDDKIITDNIHHTNDKVQQAFYIEEMESFICLDSLASNMRIIDLKCIQTSKIMATFEDVRQNENIIVDMYYSNSTCRIGALLINLTLCFWDMKEGFKHQKTILYCKQSSQIKQKKIYNLDQLNCWLTIDQYNNINFWDIETETIIHKLCPNEKEIFSVAEIPFLRAFAIGCNRKKINIYNYDNKTLVNVINIFKNGIHTILFCENFSILLVAGFHEAVTLIQVKPYFQELSSIGTLSTVHSGMVVAMTIIVNTINVITADEYSTIRIWDLSNFTLTSVFQFNNKAYISKLIGIQTQGTLAIFSNRTSLLKFSQFTKENLQNLNPKKFVFNKHLKQFFISSGKNLLQFSFFEGKSICQFDGISKSRNDQILNFYIWQGYLLTIDVCKKLKELKIQDIQYINLPTYLINSNTSQTHRNNKQLYCS